MAISAIKQEVVPRDWRVGVAAWLERLAQTIRSHEPPLGTQGVRLRFERQPYKMAGYPVYVVVSVRGGFRLGTVEWSPQWRKPRFRPDGDAVFDSQCVAEVFAMLKAFK